ncbi:hypothetical protein XENORESO_009870 [Xenotaenia resolanae]|uniref:Uncharacterized protein n=1 Tax=Xenotaenia resolanae TaxID=208358 RepID=A0ABV0VXI7_9TELE
MPFSSLTSVYKFTGFNGSLLVPSVTHGALCSALLLIPLEVFCVPLLLKSLLTTITFSLWMWVQRLWVERALLFTESHLTKTQSSSSCPSKAKSIFTFKAEKAFSR